MELKLIVKIRYDKVTNCLNVVYDNQSSDDKEVPKINQEHMNFLHLEDKSIVEFYIKRITFEFEKVIVPGNDKVVYSIEILQGFDFTKAGTHRLIIEDFGLYLDLPELIELSEEEVATARNFIDNSEGLSFIKPDKKWWQIW